MLPLLGRRGPVVTADVVAFIRQRLDEDEQWAREASRCRDNYTEGGEHWRWECPETDQPIPLDPTAGEFLHDAMQVSLRSSEDYPYQNIPGGGPHLALSADEVGMAVAGHIARHDPARVLREVVAIRQVVGLHEDSGDYGSLGPGPCSSCSGAEDWPCATLLALATGWSDHPDYDEQGGRP